MRATVKRKLMAKGRAKAVTQFLLECLGATTSYSDREPRRREKLPWRPFYGADIVLEPDSKLLGADGKPTGYKLAKKWTHQPGEIITSGNGRKYMVRPDHSLRAI